MTYTNFCSEDSVSSYTSSPSDISLTLLNTYLGTTDIAVSVASDPVWSVTTTGCSRDWNLQIQLDNDDWLELDKDDSGFYDATYTSTFATTYPWMAHTGPNALLEAAQIQVDTSDSSGAQDSTTLGPY